MCVGRIAAVTEIFEENGLPMARVNVGGRREIVCLLYTPAVAPGDHVVVELGFAVDVLDEAGAEEALALRDEEGER